MSCNPRKIIKASERRTVVKYRDGDTADIITVILEMDARSGNYIYAAAAECLRGKNDMETLKNIWSFVKFNVRYQADKPGNELVKSPGALFDLGHGDCKSFSIAIVALLRTLGFKDIRFRFTSYDRDDFSHVYVVCRNGGRDVILDAVHSRFNDEVPYRRKKDIAAIQAGISGISASKPINNGAFAVAFLLLTYFTLSK